MISVSYLFEDETFRKKFDQGSLRQDMMMGALIAPTSLALKTAIVDKDILHKLNVDHPMAAPTALAAAALVGAGSSAAVHGAIKGYYKLKDKVINKRK